jgi:hypothetical protein
MQHLCSSGQLLHYLRSYLALESGVLDLVRLPGPGPSSLGPSSTLLGYLGLSYLSHPPGLSEAWELGVYITAAIIFAATLGPTSPLGLGNLVTHGHGIVAVTISK